MNNTICSYHKHLLENYDLEEYLQSSYPAFNNAYGMPYIPIRPIYNYNDENNNGFYLSTPPYPFYSNFPYYTTCPYSS